MDEIKSLHDVRPGDWYVGGIGGLVGVGVALGEIAIGDGFRIGKFSARHMGIVTEASRPLFSTSGGPTVQRPPKMAQAMPGGANIIDLTPENHWTERNIFIRLPEDYPGQGKDAAAVAVAMVTAGVGYSPASYAYLAAYYRGLRTTELENLINRRRPEVRIQLPSQGPMDPRAMLSFPTEAICSQFVDDAWTEVGKAVMRDTKPQVVTPGGMTREWFRAPGTVCGGAGLLESM